jgi:MFS family permease
LISSTFIPTQADKEPQYIQPYAISKGITDENLGFYLLPILNTASIAGRIVPNIITDLVGPLNVLIPASLITGFLAFVWIGVKNLPGVLVFAILYGFFSGGFVSLPPVALITLSPDHRKLGTRLVRYLTVILFPHSVIPFVLGLTSGIWVCISAA